VLNNLIKKTTCIEQCRGWGIQNKMHGMPRMVVSKQLISTLHAKCHAQDQFTHKFPQGYTISASRRGRMQKRREREESKPNRVNYDTTTWCLSWTNTDITSMSTPILTPLVLCACRLLSDSFSHFFEHEQGLKDPSVAFISRMVGYKLQTGQWEKLEDTT
jgi:hypothetical protein